MVHIAWTMDGGSPRLMTSVDADAAVGPSEVSVASSAVYGQHAGHGASSSWLACGLGVGHWYRLWWIESFDHRRARSGRWRQHDGRRGRRWTAYRRDRAWSVSRARRQLPGERLQVLPENDLQRRDVLRRQVRSVQLGGGLLQRSILQQRNVLPGARRDVRRGEGLLRIERDEHLHVPLEPLLHQGLVSVRFRLRLLSRQRVRRRVLGGSRLLAEVSLQHARVIWDGEARVSLHGVLAPRAKLRPRIVPRLPNGVTHACVARSSRHAGQSESRVGTGERPPRRGRVRICVRVIRRRTERVRRAASFATGNARLPRGCGRTGRADLRHRRLGGGDTVEVYTP